MTAADTSHTFLRWSLVLGLAAVVSYVPSLRFGFVFDDLPAIVDNPGVHSLGGIPEALAVWKGTALNYRPVRYVSFALDWCLGGGAPWLFHLTNILLHAAASVLVFRLVCALGLARRVGLAAAWIFALHPIHVGAVDSIAARKDLLATFFYLLAFLIFLRYRRRRRRITAAGVFLAGGLALFSKEIAVTLPLALFLADLALAPPMPLLPRLRHVLHERRLFYGLWLASGAAYVTYKLLVWPATKVPRERWLDLFTNLGTACEVWARALALLLVPYRSLPDWSGITRVGQGWTALSLVGAATLTALLLVVWRHRRGLSPLALGLGFLLLSWIPTSGLLPIHEVFAEHYLYLPSVGFSLAVASLWHRLPLRLTTNAIARGALVALALFLVAWNVRLGRVWADEETLWTYSERNNPRSFRAATNLAQIYQAQGRRAEALALSRRAVALAPGSALAAANHAGLLLQQGATEDALRQAEKARAQFPQSLEVLAVLAQAQRAASRPQEALQSYRLLLARDDTPRHRGQLAEQLMLMGQMEQARPLLERAVAEDPTYSQAWSNLGVVYRALRRTKEAEAALRRAIDLAPDDPDPHNALAVLLLETGRAREARRQAELSARLGRPLHPGFAAALQESLQASGPGGP